MDRNILKKKFPSYFPVELLPEGAKEQELEVYRICKWGKIEPKAFLTTYEEYQMHPGLKEADNDKPQDIGSYSLSCYQAEKDAIKRLNFFTKYEPKAILAKGITTPSYGPSQLTKERERRKSYKSHVDWWLYEGATPHVSFKEVQIDENSKSIL